MRRSRALQASLTFLNKIIPKKNILLFNSYPPFSDKSLALYEYIIARRPDITERYRLIWGQEKNVAIPDFFEKNSPESYCKKDLLRNYNISHGSIYFYYARLLPRSKIWQWAGPGEFLARVWI